MSSTSQTWNPASYDTQHSFVWRYGTGVMEWLAPVPGERVLDLGCGTGHLTTEIAGRGAEVLGLDSSAEMIQSARTAFPSLRWEHADARDFSVEEPFDAVFSNAALHWIPREDAPEVIQCVQRALKSRGRFVLEMGGHGNIAAMAEALDVALREVAGREAAPENYFPTVGEYATIIEAGGLSVKRAELFARPTPLKGEAAGMRGWMETFRERALRPLDAETREAVLRHIEAALRPTLWNGKVWTAPYMRLRIVAVKESVVPASPVTVDEVKLFRQGTGLGIMQAKQLLQEVSSELRARLVQACATMVREMDSYERDPSAPRPKPYLRDPLEDDPQFAPLIDEAEHEAIALLQREGSRSPGSIVREKQRIIRERYGVEWFSLPQMNIHQRRHW